MDEASRYVYRGMGSFRKEHRERVVKSSGGEVKLR